jgi:acyl carrier protein
VQATLILLGRSAFPARQDWDNWLTSHPPEESTSQKIQQIQSLETLKATVRIIQADVANLAQMQEAIAQVQQEFGAIQGVIHAAAVSGGGMMQLATQQAIARALAPKVQGTRILEALLHENNLDFFILCSSLSAFRGAPGMMDYVAENAFLDAFAQAQVAQKTLPIQSLNWDRWTGVGMAQQVEARHRDLTGEVLSGGLSRAEGMAVFQRILSAPPLPQVIISTQDSSTLLQRVKVQKSLAEVLAKLSHSRPTHARPDKGKALVAPRNPVEEALAQIWQQLLGIEQVSIHDNFFELGGDSLFATQLVAQLCKTFQVELPYRQFFNAPTIAQLAECIVQEGAPSLQAERVQSPSQTQVSSQIQPRPQDRSPLAVSFAQQRLWFMDQLQPADSSHTIAQAVRLLGGLQVKALQQSFQEIVNRHEALRTTFTPENGQIMQIIHPHLEVALRQIDLQGQSPAAQEQAVQEWASAEAHRTFDLRQGPLLNVTLLRLGETEHVLLLSMHHIIADGWSINVLLQELAALYTAFAQGNPTSLPALPIQYADFALWQRNWLQGKRLETQLAYWTQQLKDLPVLTLPSDRPPAPTRNGGRQYQLLPRTLVETLKSTHQRKSITLFMTLTAAFKLWLHSYTGASDIVVGTDIANRNQAGTEHLIGFFVNQLVLRTQISGNPTFQTVLEQVRDITLDAYAHQDLPFDKLVEALNPVRDGQQTPLFQVKIVLETPQSQPFTLPGLILQPLTVDRNTVQFDLLLEFSETEQGLHSIWEYSTDRFNPSTITRMMVQFDQLLHHIAQHPNSSLSDLKSVLADLEMQQQIMQAQAYENSIQQQLATLKRNRRTTPERSSP